jgi:hypothetical protein
MFNHSIRFHYYDKDRILLSARTHVSSLLFKEISYLLFRTNNFYHLDLAWLYRWPIGGHFYLEVAIIISVKIGAGRSGPRPSKKLAHFFTEQNRVLLGNY